MCRATSLAAAGPPICSVHTMAQSESRLARAMIRSSWPSRSGTERGPRQRALSEATSQTKNASLLPKWQSTKFPSLLVNATFIADSLSAHHFEEAVLTGLVLDVDELVADLGHHVDDALITDDGTAVQVDPVEDGEAEAEERDLGVARGELAVRVADD